MYIKNIIKKFSLLFIVAAAFTACKKDADDPRPEIPDEHGKEYKYVRVLVSDELSNKISLLEPVSGKVTPIDAKYPLANLYGTASGRYSAILYQSQHLVEVFDSGLESHGDHIDVANEPKWASITAEGLKPTTLKARGRSR